MHSYRHADAVLESACSEEFEELCRALIELKIPVEDIVAAGGNESQIPKRVNGLLRPKGWMETRLKGDLLIKIEQHTDGGVSTSQTAIQDFLDGHKIDYVKNRVAFDLEWNSKDQTFDRDLYAFRTFHEAGLISAGVLLTRGESLNHVFKKLGVIKKYGASTTWMGKLRYRLQAGRNGGCPVLALGITPAVISGV